VKAFFKTKISTPLLLMAAALGSSAQANTSAVIQRTLAERLGANRVEVIQTLSIMPAQPLDEAESATVLEENSRGEARLLVRGFRGLDPASRVRGQAEYRVRYAAWALGWVASRRLSPGERLQVDAMRVQEINVAEGMAHEYRGILLSPTEDLTRLEARQTLVEGGFVTTASVRKIPDLRRGDTVRLDVLSGDVSLSTSAMALEPASLNQPVRVQTTKTKREMLGLLKEGGVVEVHL